MPDRAAFSVQAWAGGVRLAHGLRVQGVDPVKHSGELEPNLKHSTVLIF